MASSSSRYAPPGKPRLPAIAPAGGMPWSCGFFPPPGVLLCNRPATAAGVSGKSTSPPNFDEGPIHLNACEWPGNGLNWYIGLQSRTLSPDFA